MSSLQELLEQRAALERQIESTRKQERTEAVAKVRALMTEYGLTVADLGSGRQAGRPVGSGSGKVAAKYRNQATGEAWSGRGLKPTWLRNALAEGRTLEDFAV
jgi:DNA-binding protein H-NS